MKQKQKQQPTASLPASHSQQTVVRSSTFADHIAELRRRIMLIAVVFVAASGLAYTYHEALARLIMSPLNGQKLVYLTPGGGFSFIFQVSIYTGLIVSAPFIVHHIYSFIKPALPARAQRSAGRVVITAFLLIAMGIAYGYFVAVPAALHFLAGFAGDAVTPNLTADSYLSFFLSYIAGLALLSLLPLFLMFWHWVKPMSPGGLLKSERWVVLLAFIAAAIITPTPDAANQTMIAGPVILLYQFGVVAVLVSWARSKRAIRRASKQQTTDVVPEAQLDQVLAELEAPQPQVAMPMPVSQSAARLQSPSHMQQAKAAPVRKYLDIAAPANRPSQPLQAPRRVQPVQQITASPSQSQPRRTMDILPRQSRRDHARPAPVASYTSRNTTPRLVARPQLSLDGIFAPMQTA